MYRYPFAALALIATALADGSVDRTAPAAWPMLVRVDGIHDKPTAFRAFSRGATLVMQTGWIYTPTHPLDEPVARVQLLAAKDTLRGMTPAQYPLDLLARGSVVIYSSGPDSLRVVVGANPFGLVRQVAAVGRRFTVRFVADRIVIDSR